jgi:SAM-dependent methyltransferase
MEDRFKKEIINKRVLKNKVKLKPNKELTFKYKGDIYPDYIRQGNAISYVMPYAKYYLSGDILDIGGTKEWHYPEAEYINITNGDGFHAMKLPKKEYDSIISSHCLEHLKDPYYALKYWTTRLKKGGCLFLYLPHENMSYWTFDNPQHMHIFTPIIIKGWLKRMGYEKIITSEQDLYYSFSVIGWKK